MFETHWTRHARAHGLCSRHYTVNLSLLREMFLYTVFAHMFRTNITVHGGYGLPTQMARLIIQKGVHCLHFCKSSTRQLNAISNIIILLERGRILIYKIN